MFYAKSMYNGGIIIAADEVNYSDYKILGLRCLECGEEVFLKKGVKKLPHFAHFQELINSPKDCSLRVTGYCEVWNQLTPQGREQRRKLFQQFFLEMLILSHKRFCENVNKAREIDGEREIINVYLDSFRGIKKDLIKECLQIYNQSSDESSIIQALILQEVIDYLCLPYTSHLLEQVIYYTIYQENNFYLDFLVNPINVYNICQKIKNVLLDTNWLSVLSICVNKEKIKVDIGVTQLKKQNNKYYRLHINNGLIKYLKNNTSRRSKILYLGVIYKNIRICLEDDLEIILLQEINRNNTTITRKIPAARISAYSISNKEKEIIIEINWEFVNENLLNTGKIEYFLFYEKLKNFIEDFIHSKFKNNIYIKFNLVLNRRFQEAKAFFDETQKIRRLEGKSQKIEGRKEVRLQRQLIDREKNSNEVSRGLGEFLDKINYSSKKIKYRDVDNYIGSIIQEFGSNFIIKCPKCSKNKPIELKAKNLLKHLSKFHF